MQQGLHRTGRFALTGTSVPVHLRGFTMTVILRDNGIDRHYACASRADADVLFHALTALGRVVELWAGATLVARYEV